MRTPAPLPQPLSNRPFSRAEALALGLTDGRLRRRDLDKPYHGVRSAAAPAATAAPTFAGAPALAPDDLERRCRALLVRLPLFAFFSSITAAEIMELPLPHTIEGTDRLHVAVPSPTRGLKARGVIGHKVQLMGADVRQWHGIPISSPERAFCELAATLRLGDLVAVGDHLIHRGSALTTVSELQDAVLRYPGQRGRARLLHAVRLLDERAESPQESRLRVLLQRGGIIGCVANHEVRVRGRRLRIDLAFVDLKVAVEYQGDYHRDPEQWRRDMTRNSILASAGWFVMELNADDLRNPVELVSRVRRVLSSRRAEGAQVAASRR